MPEQRTEATGANVSRLRELKALRRKDPPFDLGGLVRDPFGNVGRIDVAFADLQAAIDGLAVPQGWYEKLSYRPKTAPFRRWYSVVLPDGAVLVGEDDLVAAMPAEIGGAW